MRIALALLTCFLFLNAETSFAIPAGPEVSTAGTVVGTYAGVLLPTGTTANGNDDSNSLGLFTASVPTTGLASGTVSIFVSGEAFTGTLDAFADPDSFEISGTITATYPYAILVTTSSTSSGTTTTTTTSVDVQSILNGSLKASVVADSDPFATSTERIQGTASLELSQNVDANGVPIVKDTLNFTVDGVQQSTTPSTTTTSG
ncbi:MAG: hypothetical protein QM796_17870 [Chthoniobacteraceae bacterium]